MTIIVGLAAIAVVSLFIAAVCFSYGFGCEQGVRYERSRCLHICEDSFREGKVSPTVQRVYRSIEDGNENLVTEKELWG